MDDFNRGSSKLLGSSKFNSHAILPRLLGVTGADNDGGGGIIGGGGGGGNEVSSKESSENSSLFLSHLVSNGKLWMKIWLIRIVDGDNGGRLSSEIGDESSIDTKNSWDESCDFLSFVKRQTSRWRSIDPGRVRGGTLFCGDERPG